MSASIEFIPLSDRGFLTVDVDLLALEADREPTDAIAESIAWHFGENDGLRDSVIRIRYRATEAQHRRVDQAALRCLLADAEIHRLYQIVPDIIRESRARAEHVDETLGPLEAVSAWTVANEISSESAEALDGLTVELLGAAA